MALGCCVVLGPTGCTAINPESIAIAGEQDGFILCFTVNQVFVHNGDSPAVWRAQGGCAKLCPPRIPWFRADVANLEPNETRVGGEEFAAKVVIVC
jgi:hypothetical protein